jgi:hypothetical protein
VGYVPFGPFLALAGSDRDGLSDRNPSSALWGCEGHACLAILIGLTGGIGSPERARWANASRAMKAVIDRCRCHRPPPDCTVVALRWKRSTNEFGPAFMSTLKARSTASACALWRSTDH